MRKQYGRRGAAAVLLAAWMLLVPVVAALAQVTRPPAQPVPPRKGMSTGKKLLAVGGAALLYYLYRKHQARQTAVRAPGTTLPTTAKRPQLYRSKNGGVYYRDANGKPVWLTVPSRPIQVSADDLRRYAPDWQRYQRMPAPAAPRGYQSRPFTEFDRNLLNTGASSAPGPAVPGPRM